MATENPTPTVKLVANGSTWADGQALAVQLLHELEEHDLEFDAYSLDPAERAPGKPQVDILARYLESIDRAASPKAKEGFTALLSDYLAGAAAGGTRDAMWYDALIDGDTAQPAGRG